MKITNIQTFKDLKRDEMYQALLEYLSEEYTDKGYTLPDDILLPIYDTLREREIQQSVELQGHIIHNFCAGYSLDEIADMLDISTICVQEVLASYVKKHYRQEININGGKSNVAYVTKINDYLRSRIYMDGWAEELSDIIKEISENYGISIEEVEEIVDNFICRL